MFGEKRDVSFLFSLIIFFGILDGYWKRFSLDSRLLWQWLLWPGPVETTSGHYGLVLFSYTTVGSIINIYVFISSFIYIKYIFFSNICFFCTCTRVSFTQEVRQKMVKLASNHLSKSRFAQFSIWLRGFYETKLDLLV